MLLPLLDGQLSESVPVEKLRALDLGPRTSLFVFCVLGLFAPFVLFLFLLVLAATKMWTGIMVPGKEASLLVDPTSEVGRSRKARKSWLDLGRSLMSPNSDCQPN